MEALFFSIVVVCLNPGKKLAETMESIRSQTWNDYEVIVKDGGSTDGSLQKLPEDVRIRRFVEKDAGIYDAMNQAAAHVRGRFVIFLNCGDLFYDAQVLARMAEAIRRNTEKPGDVPWIFYGNQYNRLQGSEVHSAPEINDLTCYRNVPCHQVCFYERSLFAERGYDVRYRVRADYEHFLYSIYERGARAVSTGILVASYEGGGFSETKENRKRSAREHREITERYLGTAKCFRYRALMFLTLAPLRTKIAESPRLSGAYNRVKTAVYGWKAGKRR